MLNWLKVLISSVLLLGCGVGSVDTTETSLRNTNLDSLFSIGDSVLATLYIQQAVQQTNMDSLSVRLLDYKSTLQNTEGKLKDREKVESEIRQRIIFKDTIVYRQETHVTHITVRDTIYITDTIRDTVYVKKRKKKRSRNQTR